MHEFKKWLHCMLHRRLNMSVIFNFDLLMRKLSAIKIQTMFSFTVVIFFSSSRESSGSLSKENKNSTQILLTFSCKTFKSEYFYSVLHNKYQSRCNKANILPVSEYVYFCRLQKRVGGGGWGGLSGGGGVRGCPDTTI